MIDVLYWRGNGWRISECTGEKGRERLRKTERRWERERERDRERENGEVCGGQLNISVSDGKLLNKFSSEQFQAHSYFSADRMQHEHWLSEWILNLSARQHPAGQQIMTKKTFVPVILRQPHGNTKQYGLRSLEHTHAGYIHHKCQFGELLCLFEVLAECCYTVLLTTKLVWCNTSCNLHYDERATIETETVLFAISLQAACMDVSRQCFQVFEAAECRGGGVKAPCWERGSVLIWMFPWTP